MDGPHTGEKAHQQSASSPIALIARGGVFTRTQVSRDFRQSVRWRMEDLQLPNLRNRILEAVLQQRM